jgi:hypothetical protein
LEIEVLLVSLVRLDPQEPSDHRALQVLQGLRDKQDLLGPQAPLEPRVCKDKLAIMDRMDSQEIKALWVQPEAQVLLVKLDHLVPRDPSAR